SGIHNAVVSDAGAVLAGRGNIIVLANEHNHELLPVIRHTVRRNFEIEGVLVTRLTSTYVHGQLRTIDVQIRSQSTEGDGSYITTSASMSFLINRP
ncbi:MAG: hypothetical protein FWC11_04380, partial [Firmicutes bacterium]|nr:hypothetical protein [Bacillota bacterium]